MILGIVLLVVIIAIPAALVALKTKSQGKRGCGRGCSTCGNYHLCHGTGAYADVDQEQM